MADNPESFGTERDGADGVGLPAVPQAPNAPEADDGHSAEIGAQFSQSLPPEDVIGVKIVLVGSARACGTTTCLARFLGKSAADTVPLRDAGRRTIHIDGRCFEFLIHCSAVVLIAKASQSAVDVDLHVLSDALREAGHQALPVVLFNVWCADAAARGPSGAAMRRIVQQLKNHNPGTGFAAASARAADGSTYGAAAFDAVLRAIALRRLEELPRPWEVPSLLHLAGAAVASTMACGQMSPSELRQCVPPDVWAAAGLSARVSDVSDDAL